MDRPSLDAVYNGGAAGDAGNHMVPHDARGTLSGSDDGGWERGATPFQPSLLHDTMQIIELHLSAQDIGSLARVDTLWRASLATHAVTLALLAMRRGERTVCTLPEDAKSANAACAHSIRYVLDILANIPSPHGLTLVREFAARMSRSPGAYTPPVTAVWRDVLNDPVLFTETLRHDADTIRRDRLAIELHAFVPFKCAAPWQVTVVRMATRTLADLPLRHQPDILSVLLARGAPEMAYPHVRRLLARLDEWDMRPSLRVLSSLAVMMLFDVSREAVCATLCKKFGLEPNVTRTQLEPLIARDFVSHFCAKAQPLRQVLYRWHHTPNALGIAVHRRLIIESATRLRGCASAVRNQEANGGPGQKTTRAFERLYGVPAHAAARIDIDAAMLSFWDVYQSLTGSPWFGVSTGWPAFRADIDRLPWVLQPTLMGRLVTEAYYLQWSRDSYCPIEADVIAWEARIVRQCLDYGYPVLAQRALMVQIHLQMCQRKRWSKWEMSESLDRVFRIVQDQTAVATWGEWLESLCAIKAYASSNWVHHTDWHHELPFQECLQRFVCDREARVFAPSRLFRLALIRESVHFWDSVPLDPDPSVTKFDGFCDRMDLLEDDRALLRKRLSAGQHSAGIGQRGQ